MFRFGDPGGRIYGSVGTSNVNLLALWTNAGGSWSVAASAGRTTGSALRWGTSSNSWLQKTLDNQATWGVAFAIKIGGSGNGQTIVALIDAATVQVDLRLNSSNQLYVTRGGTTLGTSTALATSTWYHVEFKAKIDPSAGTAEVRINGVAAIGPLSSQNTRSTSNSYASVVQVGTTGNGPAASTDFDDIIVWDGQATDANGYSAIHDFIGDCGLAWLPPSGAGTTTQFTPDSGSNYARVNESTPDGDTSYVESSTVGNIDTYALSDLPGSAVSVVSVASVHYARKTDVGSRGVKAELRSAGGNAAHATEIALADSYQYYFSNWGQDPNNGTPTNWTVSAVNALEAGQTVSS